jgi:hypothetical protein
MSVTLRHLSLVTILSSCEINNFAGQSAKSVCYKRSFQILFEELAEPALPEHEVHIGPFLASSAAAVAQAFPTAMGGGRGALHSQQILPAYRCRTDDARSPPMPRL